MAVKKSGGSTGKSGKSASASPDADTRILLLYGPDEMSQREGLGALKAAKAQAFGEVEVLRFGANEPLASVFDELRSMGLMQQHKIVIVENADEFAKLHRPALERYAANPLDSATLVLIASKWNRGKLDDAIDQVGLRIECKAMTPAKVVTWLKKRAREHHPQGVTDDAANALAERVGADLLLLDNELAKAALNATPGEPIGVDGVTMLSVERREDAAWAIESVVLRAITQAGQRRPGAGREAIEKVRDLIDLSGQPIEVVNWFTMSVLRKLFRVSVRLAGGAGMKDATEDMRLWGEARTLFEKAVRAFPPAAFGGMLARLTELDQRAKSGRGQARRNLEGFYATLADIDR